MNTTITSQKGLVRKRPALIFALISGLCLVFASMSVISARASAHIPAMPGVNGLAGNSGHNSLANFLPGEPAGIAVSAGSDQTTLINHAFSLPLSAIVVDINHDPVSGVEVTFSAPASGPGGNFATTGENTDTAITGTDGIAISSILTANDLAGGFAVQATVGGVDDPAVFTLHNLISVFLPVIIKTLPPPGPVYKAYPANQALYAFEHELYWVGGEGATTFDYCIDEVDDNTCNTSWQITTWHVVQLSNLKDSTPYYWQVRALNADGTATYADDGAWYSFQTRVIPKAGFWWDDEAGIYFYVIPEQTWVSQFHIYVILPKCYEGWLQYYDSTRYDSIQISDIGEMVGNGSYYVDGVFYTDTTVSGRVVFTGYTACKKHWYGDRNYNAVWIDASQPDSVSSTALKYINQGQMDVFGRGANSIILQEQAAP